MLTSSDNAIPDGAARAIDKAADSGRDTLSRLSHQASDIAHQTADQLRHRGEQVRDGTLLQIREHPLRSVLLAAGVGVALTLLIRQLVKH
jgi:ElaB/YqjD/DUF883 family membrane-anchored ribosome-binding protein